MGIKLEELIIASHNHDELLAYLRDFGFAEFMMDREDNDEFRVEAGLLFPMAPQLGIDIVETYHVGGDTMELEASAKTPWCRLNIRHLSVYDHEFALGLSKIFPKARIACFSSNSVSDSGSFWRSQAGEILYYRQWSWTDSKDSQKRELTRGRRDLIDEWEAWLVEVVAAENSGDHPDADSAYFVYEYWTHLFPEVPIRHDLTRQAWSKSEAMVEHLEFVVAEYSASAELWGNLGYHHNQLGNYERALVCLERANTIEKLPTFEASIGFALAQQNRFDEALVHIDAAIAAGADDTPNRAWVLAQLGRHDEAVRECDAYLAERKPLWHYQRRCWLAFENKAYAQMMSGETNAAMRTLTEFIEAAPTAKKRLREDSDLTPLHDHPDFAALVAGANSADH